MAFQKPGLACRARGGFAGGRFASSIRTSRYLLAKRPRPLAKASNYARMTLIVLLFRYLQGTRRDRLMCDA